MPERRPFVRQAGGRPLAEAEVDSPRTLLVSSRTQLIKGLSPFPSLSTTPARWFSMAAKDAVAGTLYRVTRCWWAQLLRVNSTHQNDGSLAKVGLCLIFLGGCKVLRSGETQSHLHS